MAYFNLDKSIVLLSELSLDFSTCVDLKGSYSG